jgi:hypothetical protein
MASQIFRQTRLIGRALLRRRPDPVRTSLAMKTLVSNTTFRPHHNRAIMIRLNRSRSQVPLKSRELVRYYHHPQRSEYQFSSPSIFS